MVISKPLPDVMLQKGSRTQGFLIQNVTVLKDIRMIAYQCLHEKSGAQLLHLHSVDRENLFAIAFRTPPPDDTGLPHILEHTVLCGSRRHPVKDPFVELLKSSLATFLNAMTYPDRTVYPCASVVEKDFFNLASVYCDAVFHPLISEKHFKQEGHHFDFVEPGNPRSPLIIKGIVYNEMRGIYSDLDGIIDRHITKSICPDNAYGKDSGGDPDVIPDLSYDQFKRFHRTHYHPSNALVFVYGDVSTERILEFLDGECLGEFERSQLDTRIPAQPRWSEPRYETILYPAGPNEDTASKTAVILNLLTNDVTDAIRSLSMSVIDYYLLGNAASPLRKALIDSQLGQELTDSGYASYQRDTYFTVGLKGSEPENREAIVDLIRHTCASLVENGMEKSKLESAFHRLELGSREIQAQYPLHLMDRVYRSWLYDADPLYYLRLNEKLAELRRRYEREERFFERQLEELIVRNPHCSVLTFVPDREYMTRKEGAFRARMEKEKQRMNSADLNRIVKEAEELNAMQSTPNAPETLATLPRLSLADVPKESFELNTTVDTSASVPLLYTDMFSNGVNYLILAFDLRGIEEELVEYVPLYADVLRKMGAGEDDYVVMAEREAAATGGVGTSLSAGGRTNDPLHVQPLMFVSSSCLNRNFRKMLDVMADRMVGCDLTDLGRLRDVILQTRIGLRSEIVPNGWQYALAYAQRNLSRNAALSEQMGGVTQVRLLDRLASDFDGNREGILHKLGRIQEFLLARGRLTASFLGDAKHLKPLREWLSEFTAQLRDESPPEETVDFDPQPDRREGLAIPADVAFVATASQVVGAAHEDAPALLLLSTHLSYGYLWDEIRVKNGAYGARAAYDPLSGLFGFASYRDPRIKETLDVYTGVFDYLAKRMDLSATAMEKAIIGTVKGFDRPIRPGQAVGVALNRYLKGETKELRRAFREKLLSLNGDEIRRVSMARLQPAFRTAPVCVLSSREKLEAANQALDTRKLTVLDL